MRKALKKGLEQPHVPGTRLHGDLATCHKIKLRKQSYRLAYSVEDDVFGSPGASRRQAGEHGGNSVRGTAVAWWRVTSVPEIRLDILDKFWTLRLCMGVYGRVWACTKVMK